MSAALFKGTVWHQRFSARRHAFQYKLFMVWLDLDRLDEIFGGRWLWSHRFPTLAWFRREDHAGDPDIPLGDYIRDVVEERTGTRPEGPIRLLTHLRYFGFYMNPIALYYCYDADDAQVEYVVAEVHNTPWNERHLYLWPGEVCRNPESAFRCVKKFHVSPFMGMNQVYRCQLNEPGDELKVHLQNEQHRRVVFAAGMTMQRESWTSSALNWTLLLYPFMTLRIFLAIYLQALRLWWKGVPVQPHPNRKKLLEEPESP